MVSGDTDLAAILARQREKQEEAEARDEGYYNLEQSSPLVVRRRGRRKKSTRNEVTQASTSTKNKKGPKKSVSFRQQLTTEHKFREHGQEASAIQKASKEQKAEKHRKDMLRKAAESYINQTVFTRNPHAAPGNGQAIDAADGETASTQSHEDEAEFSGSETDEDEIYDSEEASDDDSASAHSSMSGYNDPDLLREEDRKKKKFSFQSATSWIKKSVQTRRKRSTRDEEFPDDLPARQGEDFCNTSLWAVEASYINPQLQEDGMPQVPHLPIGPTNIDPKLRAKALTTMSAGSGNSRKKSAAATKNSTSGADRSAKSEDLFAKLMVTGAGNNQFSDGDSILSRQSQSRSRGKDLNSREDEQIRSRGWLGGCYAGLLSGCIPRLRRNAGTGAGSTWRAGGALLSEGSHYTMLVGEGDEQAVIGFK